ncbi:AAA domain (dynein-related subfamily) [Calidithermus terrae]|uniref:AAA domain (Dynein-related subfamily) n=1 Tax=Calidithermus terrae TaxID=1408545 RepID=A0A399EHP6_9DEIN|nr:MoxR family ATPase [Calidithermus terrae]RIH84184.1 AAA domain (dynein-related subfamily) [Calidithermus terrae]
MNDANKAVNKAVGMALAGSVPVHLIGAPGVGKTALVESLARRWGRHLEVVVASNRDRTDFGGFPVLEGGEVLLAPQAWVKRLVTAPQGAILFLDEIGGTPPDVRPVMLRVLAERWVGEVRLPPERVAIMAASNPSEWGEGEGPESFSLAMRTRMAHLHYPAPGAQEFAQALLSGWGDPLAGVELPTAQAVDARGGEAKALVTGFLARYPEAVAPTPKPGQEVWGWPNPRTWERMAVPALAAWLALGAREADREALELLLVGILGPYGQTFGAWLREQDLPDPEAILADPEGHPLPGRADLAYATVGALTAAVTSRPSAPRWDAAWRFLRRLVPDLQIIGARTLAAAYREGEWGRQGLRLPQWIEGLLPLVDRVEAAKQ